MPQMSPLMWMVLFLFFSFMLVVTLSKVFFSSSTPILKTSTSSKLKEHLSKNWMW